MEKSKNHNTNNNNNNNNNIPQSKKREFPADGSNNSQQHGKGFKKSKNDLKGRAKALLPQRKALPIYSGIYYINIIYHI